MNRLKNMKYGPADREAKTAELKYNQANSEDENYKTLELEAKLKRSIADGINGKISRLRNAKETGKELLYTTHFNGTSITIERESDHVTLQTSLYSDLWTSDCQDGKKCDDLNDYQNKCGNRIVIDRDEPLSNKGWGYRFLDMNNNNNHNNREQECEKFADYLTKNLSKAVTKILMMKSSCGG